MVIFMNAFQVSVNLSRSIIAERMKVKVVFKKVYDYILYDSKEIAFPSSVPDPLILKIVAN